MKIVSIAFKNILTFGGDIENVIELSDSGSLTQISGDNGLGKSNIVKLLEIGLYYKYPSLVSKVVNDLAKEGHITITVLEKGHLYVVENLFKNSKLYSVKVQKDGVVQDWGNVSKASSLVQTEIASVPYSIFSNILSTSIDSDSSLLKLSAKDGRDIVNNVFDLSEVNRVNDAFVSGEFTMSNTNHTVSTNNIDATEKIITSTLESIEELKELDRSLSETKKVNYLASVESLRAEATILDTNTNVLYKSVTFLDDEIKYSAYHKDQNTLSDIISDIYENSVKVEECETDLEKYRSIESSRFMNIAYDQTVINNTKLEELKSNGDTYNSSLKTLKEEFEVVNNRMIDVREFLDFRERMKGVNINRKEFSETNDKIAKHNEDILELSEKINNINTSIRDDKDISDSLKIKLEFYKKGKCAVCDVDFTSDGYPKLIEELEAKILSYDVENKAYIKRRGDIEAQGVLLNKAKGVLIDRRSELISIIKQTSKELPKLVTDEIVLDFNKDIDLNEFEKYDYKVDLIELQSSIDKKSESIEGVEKSIILNDTNINYTKVTITDIAFEAKSKFGIDVSTYEKKEVLNDMSDEDLKTLIETKTKEVSVANTVIKSSSVSKEVIENKWKTVSEDIISRFALNANPPLDITKCEEDKKLELAKIKIKEDRNTIIRSDIDGYNKLLKELEEDKDSEYVVTLNSTLDKTRQNLESQKKIFDTTKDEYEAMQFIKTMYNSGGLKTALVSKVIGDINSTIDNIMASSDIPVSVSYDAEFTPSFTKFGDEILYDQLSVGQKKMLEVVSIISIITYYRKSFPSINFLYVDEALSSLSDTNTHKMLSSIIEWVVLKLGINVFLTSHAHISNSMLNRSIKLGLKNGYTVINP